MEKNSADSESNDQYIEYLSKRLGFHKAILIICWSVLGLIVLAGLFLFFQTLSIYDFENASPYLMIIPVSGLLFFLPSLYILKEVRELQKEIKELSTENHGDEHSVENTTKKNTRRSLIAITCFIVSVVIVIYMIVGGAVSSSRCVKCGDKGVYTKSGYCYSCYRKVYNNIKENGK